MSADLLPPPPPKGASGAWACLRAFRGSRETAPAPAAGPIRASFESGRSTFFLRGVSSTDSGRPVSPAPLRSAWPECGIALGHASRAVKRVVKRLQGWFAIVALGRHRTWLLYALTGILVALFTFGPTWLLFEAFALKLKAQERIIQRHGVGALCGAVSLFGFFVAGLSAWLVVVVAPDAAASGLPQLIAFLAEAELLSDAATMRLTRYGDHFTWLTVIIKIISLWLANISGLRVGRVGPNCHIGAAIAYKIAEAALVIDDDEKFAEDDSGFAEGLARAKAAAAADFLKSPRFGDAKSDDVEIGRIESGRRSRRHERTQSTVELMGGPWPTLRSKQPHRRKRLPARTRRRMDLKAGDSGIVHTLITAGGATGLATAFNAPLGGILYMLEEITQPSAWSTRATRGTFLAAALTTLTSKIILALIGSRRADRYRSAVVGIGLVEDLGWHVGDMIPFLFLGLVTGLSTGWISKKSYDINCWRKDCAYRRSNAMKVLEISVVAAVTSFAFCALPLIGDCRPDPKFDDDEDDPGDAGLFGLRRLAAAGLKRVHLRHVRYTCPVGQYSPLATLSLTGDGGAITALLQRGDAHLGQRAILLFALVYCPAVMAVMGSVVPAGTFGPMLLFGAAIGRAVGEGLNTMRFGAEAPFSDAGVYAAIGAACALGGFTRTTIAVVATICEITGDVSLIAPTMAALCVSRFCSSVVGGNEGYTRMLLSRMLREQPELGLDLSPFVLRPKPSVIQLLHDQSQAAPLLKRNKHGSNDCLFSVPAYLASGSGARFNAKPVGDDVERARAETLGVEHAGTNDGEAGEAVEGRFDDAPAPAAAPDGGVDGEPDSPGDLSVFEGPLTSPSPRPRRVETCFHDTLRLDADDEAAASPRDGDERRVSFSFSAPVKVSPPPADAEMRFRRLDDEDARSGRLGDDDTRNGRLGDDDTRNGRLGDDARSGRRSSDDARSEPPSSSDEAAAGPSDDLRDKRRVSFEPQPLAASPALTHRRRLGAAGDAPQPDK
ncbi:voltage gated chloride channel-domain-containing protein [Pelagophyceae sp. CCMP2097]|nr:voltage gated chloride channel-domain-containing protein [Pelagophyceae sp. CCMP2097]